MQLEFSKQAFYEAWDYFELGTKPIVLNVLPEGVMMEEREAAQARAWQELRQKGFGELEFDENVKDLFLALYRYDSSFDITYRYRTSEAEFRISGLATTASTGSALGLMTDDHILIRGLDTESPARAVLGVLGETRAGKGRAVSLRSAQLESAGKEANGSSSGLSEALMDEGLPFEQAQFFIDTLNAYRKGFAQFGANIMDSFGKRTRATRVTNCFEIESGWYVLEERTSGDEPWTTLAPVDHAGMLSRIEDLTDAIERD